MIRRVSSGVQNHVMGRKRTIRKRIKNWHKSLLLFVFLLLYLVFGAMVFKAIEKDYQLEAQRDLNDFSEEFLGNHSECLTREDLRAYVTLLLEAAEKGAILSKEFDTTSNNLEESLWSLPNAFFFSSTVVTTIGYGNIFPNTGAGKIVCIFYALVGIPLTGWMLSCIGQTFHDKWQAIGKIIRKITFRTKSKQVNYTVHIVVVFLLAYSAIIVIPALIISYAEDWAYIDAHYFCFISLTTIGFGDLAPQTWTDANTEFNKWLQTGMYVTYLLLGLSLLSVALTAFLRKHEGKFKSAGKRMKRFVAHSARSATVRMKEATDRSHSVGSTPESSFKQGCSNKTNKNEPKLLKIVARVTSMEENKKTAPWQVQSEHERALAKSGIGDVTVQPCKPHPPRDDVADEQHATGEEAGRIEGGGEGEEGKK